MVITWENTGRVKARIQKHDTWSFQITAIYLHTNKLITFS